jgi:hypothetical protein
VCVLLLVCVYEQVGVPGEEDLKAWGHHGSVASVPDAVLRQIGDEHITFVFSCQIEGREVEDDRPLSLPAPPATQVHPPGKAAAAAPLPPRPQGEVPPLPPSVAAQARPNAMPVLQPKRLAPSVVAGGIRSGVAAAGAQAGQENRAPTHGLAGSWQGKAAPPQQQKQQQERQQGREQSAGTMRGSGTKVAKRGAPASLVFDSDSDDDFKS